MAKEQINKKDHIMEVAEKLFSENGFEGTSTRMIASKANVNLAMVSYYFGGKEQLFQELVDRKMQHVRLVLSNLIEENTTSWEKMDKFIDLQVERMFNNRQFSCLIHREMSLNQRTELTSVITESIYKNNVLIMTLMTDGQANGEFKKDIDIPMIMASIYGTISQLVNSAPLSAKLLGFAPNDPEMYGEPIRARVKAHIKTLIKPILLNIAN